MSGLPFGRTTAADTLLEPRPPRPAKELMRDEPFDLCHCWSGFPAGLVGWWLRHRQPYLVSLRGSDVPGLNRRLCLLEPLLLAGIARRIWRDAAGYWQ